MPKKTRSAKGEVIDFDLLKIKAQIASAPKPTDVRKREDFIDKKLRRRVKRVQRKVEQTAIEVEPTITDNTEVKEVEVKEAPKTKKKRTVKKKKS